MNVKQLLIYILPPIFLVPVSLFFFVWSISNTPMETKHLVDEQKALFSDQKELYQPSARNHLIKPEDNLNLQFSKSRKVGLLQTNILEDTIINKFKILTMLDKQSIEYSKVHIELFGQNGLVGNYFKKTRYNDKKLEHLFQKIALLTYMKPSA